MAGLKRAPRANGVLCERIEAGAAALERGLNAEDKAGLAAVVAREKPFFMTEPVAGAPANGQGEGQGQAIAEDWAELIALGCVRLLGAVPTAYATENGGKLIREVRPELGFETERSSHGRVDLPMHSDMTYLRFPDEESHPLPSYAPDLLVFACVANDASVPMRLVTLERILAALPARHQEALRAPYFSVRSPESVHPASTLPDLALLREHPRWGEMLRYNFAYCAAERQDGWAALSALADFVLQEGAGEYAAPLPGALLVLDNRRAIHGRGPIFPNAGLPNRWFKRVYALRAETGLAGPGAEDPFVQPG